MTTEKTVKFGDLPIGAEFRLESWFCVKQEPRVCEQSRKFYRGEVPGYQSKSNFYDWNAKHLVYIGSGKFEWVETSLDPDLLVMVKETV